MMKPLKSSKCDVCIIHILYMNMVVYFNYKTLCAWCVCCLHVLFRYHKWSETRNGYLSHSFVETKFKEEVIINKKQKYENITFFHQVNELSNASITLANAFHWYRAQAHSTYNLHKIWNNQSKQHQNKQLQKTQMCSTDQNWLLINALYGWQI